MKICFYCDTLFSFGGVQCVLAVIARALAHQHEVVILTLDSPEQEDLTMYGLDQSTIQIRYISYPQPHFWEYLPCKAYSLLYKKVLPQNRTTSRWYGCSSFPPSLQQRLIKELNAGCYDVVVGVHAFLSLRLATVRQRLNAKWVVGWMHNSYQAFFENTPSYLGGFKSHFTHQMKRIDGLVVLTRTDGELYNRQLGLYPHVIYNPLTLEPQGESRPEARKFLAVGRFSARHKGFDILIEAFALFARTNSDWTLDIVGEGPEEALLRQLIAHHGLENRVQLHPFTKQIQTYYAAASAYILSSRWEGFGLVMIEAMAHGLPVIASDLPVVRELFDGKSNVLLFKNEDAADLAEKMEQMSRNTRWKEMQEESLRTAQMLHIDTIIKEWEKMLTDGLRIT